DPIFYENPTYYPPGVLPGTPRQTQVKPVGIYQAEIKAEHHAFSVDAFYRAPRNGWEYEGDFFHLYPDTHYGENVDIYRGDALFGVVVSGKRLLDGFKIAFGPQISWRPNPTVIGKYRSDTGLLASPPMPQ